MEKAEFVGAVRAIEGEVRCEQGLGEDFCTPPLDLPGRQLFIRRSAESRTKTAKVLSCQIHVEIYGPWVVSVLELQRMEFPRLSRGNPLGASGIDGVATFGQINCTQNLAGAVELVGRNEEIDIGGRACCRLAGSGK
jgi:hypothetical protein